MISNPFLFGLAVLLAIFLARFVWISTILSAASHWRRQIRDSAASMGFAEDSYLAIVRASKKPWYVRRAEGWHARRRQ